MLTHTSGIFQITIKLPHAPYEHPITVRHIIADRSCDKDLDKYTAPG
jgi:hypothetical protein